MHCLLEGEEPGSALNAGGGPLGESVNLFEGGHGSVAGESGEQRAMRPAEPDRFVLGCARQEAVEESRGKAIPAADPVEHVELTSGRDAALATDPGYRAPTVATGRVHLTQSGGDDSDLRVLFGDFVHHAKEGAGIELGF